MGDFTQFHPRIMEILKGAQVKVGLEDNIFIKKGKLAKSNADLVKSLVQIARLLDREGTTSNEIKQKPVNVLSSPRRNEMHDLNTWGLCYRSNEGRRRCWRGIQENILRSERNSKMEKLFKWSS